MQEFGIGPFRSTAVRFISLEFDWTDRREQRKRCNTRV